MRGWRPAPEDQHRQRVAASRADVVLCTHGGQPRQRRTADTLVVNVGVLGKPRQRRPPRGLVRTPRPRLRPGDGRTGFAVVPLAGAGRASVRAAGLPEVFVETIETGWWTTCLENLCPRASGPAGVTTPTAPCCPPAPRWSGADNW